ncbi:Oxygen-independent coproporphyrinogen-III oxidase [Capnocytophaga ochracea]|uniref:Oxygen-independent coproporphyrinogen-III oxidase n=1 Tax=Capnocytophaga ochracea TaxID=1018 RepID=A0A2X2SW62_CAPOC|nr:Oxygen-independent coproporphyrinogen-III oxidase [Capnocytophaga ochracea]
MVDALCEELILRKGEAVGSELQTIYLGGGTPSILSYGELQQLFHTIFTHYKVNTTAEITLEANPDDFLELLLPSNFWNNYALWVSIDSV